MPSASPSMSAPYPPTQNRVIIAPSLPVYVAQTAPDEPETGRCAPYRRASVDQVVPDDDLLALGADSDDRDARVAHLLEGQHVVPGVLGQILEGARLRDVLAPAREVLVDRLRVVEVGLVHGHVVEAFAVDVVGNAHRDLIEAGEHVEFGEHQVCDAVHAGRVARDGG